MIRDCPIQNILTVLARKWSILILRELCFGTYRTKDLLSALPKISSKTLTAQLRELEEYGLIKRQVYAEVPPRVEYSLTQNGRDILPVISELFKFGQQHSQQEKCICPVVCEKMSKYDETCKTE